MTKRNIAQEMNDIWDNMNDTDKVREIVNEVKDGLTTPEEAVEVIDNILH